MDNGHLFSGWPGAFCRHCGAEDLLEVCLAEGCPHWDDEGGCPIHVNPPCPAKGTYAVWPEPDSVACRLNSSTT